MTGPTWTTALLIGAAVLVAPLAIFLAREQGQVWLQLLVGALAVIFAALALVAARAVRSGRM